MKGKSKLGWLYMLIILCVAFSAVMAWGLIQKIAQQKESASTYTSLSDEVVATGGALFADETVTPADASSEREVEAEDQSDTVFFINNDVTVATATVTTQAPQQTPFEPLVTLTEMEATSGQPSASATVSGGAIASPATGSPEVTITPSSTLSQTVAITPTPTVSPTPAPTEEPRLNRVVPLDTVRYSVDFGYLQILNEDVKGWLMQDGTPINYPVLQGANNDYYLNRLFNRRLNKDGSIFLDSGSSAFFIDANTYIYGHHTKTDSMFSTLADYRDQAYYDAHPQMTLLTPYSDFVIDLFAARVCLVDDETSWRVKQFLHKSEFTDYLAQLNSESLFVGKASSMPEWGDQLLVLVTCTNDTHGERYVLYGRMRQIIYSSAESVTLTKVAMDEAPTLTSWQTVPGRGQMLVYAQNDPLWNGLRYESRTSSKHRIFGSGGCGPTSVAMAIVNLVPKERLPDIFGYAKTSMGYTFCSCSVNQYFCNKLHAQYQIQTVDEYLRYYPLVMANFATGNNLWEEVARGNNAGTSLVFLKKIAYLYKLDLSVTTSNDDALAAVRDGALAIASLSGQNPFTSGGHYVVIASVDDEYLYVLDPYRQENYDKTDKRDILTVLAPGVVRVKLEDARSLFISTCYILKTTPETASADPPAVQ